VEDVVSKAIAYHRLIARNGRLFGAKGKLSMRSAMKGFETWT